MTNGATTLIGREQYEGKNGLFSSQSKVVHLGILEKNLIKSV